MFRDVFHYCAVHLEDIAGNARDLDFAVRWGFGWDTGPFEIWQAAGWQQVAGWISADIAAGKCLAAMPLPAWVTEPGRTGVHTPQGSYAPVSKTYQPRSTLSVYQRQLFPDILLGEERKYGETVFENDDIRMWHMNDGIALLSFKTKLHTISNEVLDGILRAVDEAEAHFNALILWQTEPPFSAGANLLQAMQGLQEEAASGGLLGKLKGATTRVKYTIAGGGGLGDIMNAAAGNVPRVADVVAKFQQVSQRLRYAQVPTISAVDGLVLGGGCEFSMHCSRVVATLESYIGLVEVGVGLLPAGGGSKEMTMRAAAEAQRFANEHRVDVFAYLRQSDRIVMNRFELLHVAKEEAKALNATGYRPPLHTRQIQVAGRTGIATLKAAMINLLEGGFISEYDYSIGCRIAETMCGGDVEAGSYVDEQWLLDLERKHFMELIATDKTQERIEYMLKNGKPLRN